MKNHRFNLSIVAVFALTVLFIPIGDAFAQTMIPIFIDDICASIQVGSETKVAPAHLAGELEAVYGGPATIGTLGDLIDTLDPAATGDTVRFEGSYAAGEASVALQARGYVVSQTGPSPLPSADEATILSD